MLDSGLDAMRGADEKVRRDRDMLLFDNACGFGFFNVLISDWDISSD